MAEETTSVEATVREIQRKTRKKYSAEEKVRIVLEGLRGEEKIPSCAAAKASTRICITSGPRNFWKLASSAWWATRSEKPIVTRSKTCGVRTSSSRRWWLS